MKWIALVLLLATPAAAQVSTPGILPASAGSVPILGPFTLSYGAIGVANIGLSKGSACVTVPGATPTNLYEPMLPGGSGNTIVPDKAVAATDQVCISYTVNTAVTLLPGSIQVLLAQVR